MYYFLLFVYFMHIINDILEPVPWNWDKSKCCSKTFLVKYFHIISLEKFCDSSRFDDKPLNKDIDNQFFKNVFLPQRLHFVTAFVCLFIIKITWKFMDGFEWNFKVKVYYVKIYSWFHFGNDSDCSLDSGRA